MLFLLSVIGCDFVFDSFGGYEKKRNELPQMIESIKKAEQDNFELLGFYVDAEAYPKDPGPDSQAWEISTSGGFVTIAWKPEAEVFGSYSVKVDGDGFVVKGVCDLDGDGIFATYTATKDTAAVLVTPEDVY